MLPSEYLGPGLQAFSRSSGSWPRRSFPNRPPLARLYTPAFPLFRRGIVYAPGAGVLCELGTGSACLALILTTESVGQADVCLKASMTGMVAVWWRQPALLV